MKTIKTNRTKAFELFAKAKAKIGESVASIKTKEGRGALANKAKTTVLLVKDKTVGLWKSGSKGKAAIIAASLALVWIIIPFGGEKCSTTSESDNSARVMADAGLKKMHDGEAMFYESGEKQEIGDHLSYNTVKPNLYILPSFIKTAFLETAVYPTCEKEKGDAFAPQIGGLNVVNVGDGYVLVGMFNDAAQKWFYAYVRTDDEYVDDQPLKEGYYAYTGTHTVLMTDGSNHTMPAFEKLDDAYIAAVAYNAKAENAADAENARRRDEATNKQDTDVKDFLSKVVLEMAKDAEEKDLAERTFIPAKLQAKARVRLEVRWKWTDDASLHPSANFISRDEFVSRMEKGELPCFLAKTDRYDTKERMQSLIESDYRKYRVVAEIPSDAGLDIYTIHPNKGVSSFIPKYNADDLFDALTIVAVVEAPKEQPLASSEETAGSEYDEDDIPELRPEDPLKAFQTSDVGQFMKAYKEIYGK